MKFLRRLHKKVLVASILAAISCSGIGYAVEKGTTGTASVNISGITTDDGQSLGGEKATSAVYYDGSKWHVSLDSSVLDATNARVIAKEESIITVDTVYKDATGTKTLTRNSAGQMVDSTGKVYSVYHSEYTIGANIAITSKPGGGTGGVDTGVVVTLGDVTNTLDTGSVVRGTKDGDYLSSLSINGVNFDLAPNTKYTAGTNVQISEDNVISATDTKYTAGTNVTISDDNVISATGVTYTAGTNVSISEDNVISATDTKYTAGNNVTIGDDNVIHAVDTKYTAGDNVQISEDNVITATDTKYTAGNNVTIGDDNVIHAVDTQYTAGDNVQISEDNVITATDTKYTAGTNVTISDDNEISATDTNTVFDKILADTGNKKINFYNDYDAEGDNTPVGGIKFSAGGGAAKTVEGTTTYEDTYITVGDGENSFKLDTGSKVEGSTFTADKGDFLDTLNINGQDFKLARLDSNTTYANVVTYSKPAAQAVGYSLTAEEPITVQSANLSVYDTAGTGWNVEGLAMASDVYDNKVDITNIEGDITTINTNINTINTNITEIKGDITEIDNRVTKNEGDINTINTNITEIQGDITEIDNRVTKNETDITNIKGDINTINGSLIDHGVATYTVNPETGVKTGTIALNHTNEDETVKLVATVTGLEDTTLKTSEQILSKTNHLITVEDTSGKKVTIDNVASMADIEEAKTEAAKHTTLTEHKEATDNIQVKTTETTDGHLNYDVTLNKEIKVEQITIENNEGNKTTIINGDTIKTITKTEEGDKITVIEGDKIETTNLVTNNVTTNNISITNEEGKETVNITNKNITINGKGLAQAVSQSESGTKGVTDHTITYNLLDAEGKEIKDGTFTSRNTTLVHVGTVDLSKATDKNTITVKDTEGNIVQYTNVASLADIQAASGTTTVLAGENVVVDEKLIGEKGKEYTVSVSKDLKNMESITFNNSSVTINKEGISVGDINITKNNIDAGKKKIVNVDPGELSENSTDAVNGAQLHQTNTVVNNIANEVNNFSGRLNGMDNRINKVGAGAAALAALHPMDFDPDDKLSLAVGTGHYKGQTAAAVGAFYRPSEKVMLSIGATAGNGENMVNMGASFALDGTPSKTNTKTAMAKEIIRLNDKVAKFENEIAQLKSMLNQVLGNKTASVEVNTYADTPENHWAYECLNDLRAKGYIAGEAPASMTRAEIASALNQAMQNGAQLNDKILEEFSPELGAFRVERVEDYDGRKIERLRLNKGFGRDAYGKQVAKK